MIVSRAQFPGSTVVMATEADTVNAEASSIEQLVNEAARNTKSEAQAARGDY